MLPSNTLCIVENLIQALRKERQRLQLRWTLLYSTLMTVLKYGVTNAEQVMELPLAPEMIGKVI